MGQRGLASGPRGEVGGWVALGLLVSYFSSLNRGLFRRVICVRGGGLCGADFDEVVLTAVQAGVFSPPDQTDRPLFCWHFGLPPPPFPICFRIIGVVSEFLLFYLGKAPCSDWGSRAFVWNVC